MHAYVCARVLCLLGARTRDATLVGALGRSIGHCRGRGLDRRPIGYRVCTPRTIAPMMHAAHTQAAAASIIVWPGSFNSFTPGPHNHTHASNQKQKKKTRHDNETDHGTEAAAAAGARAAAGRAGAAHATRGLAAARRGGGVGTAAGDGGGGGSGHGHDDPRGVGASAGGGGRSWICAVDSGVLGVARRHWCVVCFGCVGWV